MATEETLLQADFSGSEDEGEDERKHNQLVDAISSLDGKNRHKLSQRTVPTNQVSEFNFATSGEGASKVRLHELIGSLKDTAKLGNIKRQLNIVDKRKKVVSTPLPKHEKQKIDRSIAYESTKQDVSKWDTVVSKNRLAEQLQFPLQKPDFKLATIDDYVKRCELRTPLEVQVAALLRGSDYVVKDNKQDLTPAEQRALKAMDVQEARERHAELMKHKALLSYQEAKARWRNKIKSKRYHRMLKKTRLKQERKALDELEKNDPEGYTEKLRQLDRDRIQERMSLKHRGGSKYAKKQMIYAKYDNKARDEVQDMLQKSHELTKKLEDNSEIEDSEGGVTPDEEDEAVTNGISSDRGDNPWMTRARPAKKDNPWMSKSEIISKSEFMRPEAYKSALTGGEDVSDAEMDNDIDETIEHEASKRSRNHKIDSDNDDDDSVETADLTSGTNSSNLRTDDHDDVDNNSDDEKDDIEEIFSSASKKAKHSKSDSKESKKKGKGKKKRKKQKILTEKGENVNKQREKNETNTTERNSKRKKTENDSANDEIEEEEDDTGLISEGLNRKRTLEEIENSESDEEAEEPKKVRKDTKKEGEKKHTEKEVYVDPKKLFTLESKLKQVGSGPDLVADDDNDLDPEEQQRMTIAQAFADDDVIEEFQRDKELDVDRNKPKDIDLTLPGWGDWGGAGIQVSKRKKRRFRIKAPPAAPRRDLHLGNVIINEQKTQAVVKHQVNELPYPFVNSEQFEKSIRAPLGKTWNTETAYRELVKPKVVTRLGKIITPIDKSEVYKNLNKKSDFNESGKNKEGGKDKDTRRSNYNRGDSRKKHVKDKNPGKKKMSK